MRACLRLNRPGEALILNNSMVARLDPLPDRFTYPIVLQACALRENKDEGKAVHAHVQKRGFCTDVYTVNTLINMYSVCGDIDCARKMFDRSSVVDHVSWNSILACYVRVGDSKEAMEIFARMPEKSTIAINSMIALLARVGQPMAARELFDKMRDRDIVTWSAIISCYDQNLMYVDALKMFTEMIFEGVRVDEVVMISAISSASCLGSSKEGELLHSFATKTGIDTYLNLNNALINMYSSFCNIPAAEKLFNSCPHLDQISANSMLSGYLKSRLVDFAVKLFHSMPRRDDISWSIMISGFSQNDLCSETLSLFEDMLIEKFVPDQSALVSVLSACARLTSLKQGKWVHSYILRRCLTINPILGTSLIDMYMKCGCVDHASSVFMTMEERGVSSWNATIIGLATNGLPAEALEKFLEMKQHGYSPNEVTFVGALSACRYLGAVREGQRIFSSMTEEHQIEPNLLHYGCLVDLLGKAGMLKDAEDLIKKMPMAPDIATLGALLGACQKHGDIKMGERVGKRMIDIEPGHDGAHVLLFNMYASRGRWEEAEKVRSLMKEKKVGKMPGCSMVEAHG